MRRRRGWYVWAAASSAVVAWVLANGLDVVSALYAVQYGGTLSVGRYHPAEALLIYGGMRMLGTLAILLLGFFVRKHWPSTVRIVWSGLTVGALVTAISAWLRLYK